MKRQATDREKKIQYIYLTKIPKELQSNKKKTNNTIFIHCIRNWNRHFIKDIKRVNKHKKRYISYQKMQISHPIECLQLKGVTVPNNNQDVQQLQLSCTTSGVGPTQLENCQFLIKFNIHLPCKPAISFLDIYTQKK